MVMAKPPPPPHPDEANGGGGGEGGGGGGGGDQQAGGGQAAFEEMLEDTGGFLFELPDIGAHLPPAPSHRQLVDAGIMMGAVGLWNWASNKLLSNEVGTNLGGLI